MVQPKRAQKVAAPVRQLHRVPRVRNHLQLKNRVALQLARLRRRVPAPVARKLPMPYEKVTQVPKDAVGLQQRHVKPPKERPYVKVGHLKKERWYSEPLAAQLMQLVLPALQVRLRQRELLPLLA